VKQIFILLIFYFCAVGHANAQTDFTIDPFGYDRNAYEEVHIDYTIKGRGDTVLFFIHGWNLNQNYWTHQVNFFAPRFKVLTVDLAGHGQSGRDRKIWSVESFAKDLNAIISKEQLKNVILVAHSMAGEIAVEMATAGCSACIGIVGVDNFKQINLTVTQEQRNGIIPYAKDFIIHYKPKAEAMAKELINTKDDSLTRTIVEDYKNAPPEIAVCVLMNIFPKAAELKYKLPMLTFPLWIVRNDGPFNNESLKKYCKYGYREKVIKACGHFPMVENPNEFNIALNDLLKRQ
jgi:sigma-B regulation protein RsbQ